MAPFVLLGVILCLINDVSAVMHSWKAFYTASTGLSEFPEFVAVGMVDDEKTGYFDSRTSHFQYRQKWMEENLGQDYAKQQTDGLKGLMPVFKANVRTAIERFNQSGGAHVFQRMYGCEWDDETGITDGWNNNPANLQHYKSSLTQECIEWLKRYVSYGRSTLERTVAPEVSLLQKDPSSPVVCHVTGFFPRGVMVTWQKNGEDHYDDVEWEETVPNEDGTFQTTSRLTVKDWQTEDYTCVVEHKSLEKEIVKRVIEGEIRRNQDIETHGPSMGVIIIGCVVGVLTLVCVVVGVVVWKKRGAGERDTPTHRETDTLQL
ncbi:hypothetical protein AAFF_G00422240 [Aldrovandia affinis]|uniref:Ig-like domain-containing protein n=1 Tax=Aldrovandia affinis TaxID=143900 RepID=A0AAD7R363_9TELE|nr:hypothetical protein AAFF_G00422240 [Aldrovandia affinis]